MDSGMQAVIMAGGEGSRLRPLTSNIPKPMLPIANRPMMEHIITLLKRNGVKDIVATVQFLSSVIRNYFDDGSDLGVSLSYATEDVPLGTAGSVLAASDLLSGTFLVISGDALTDFDLQKAVDYHRSKGAAATIVLKRMEDPLDFGIVMTAEDGRIERFLEKPTWGQVFTDTINTGMYVLEPEVLDLIPPDEPFDFSSQVFPAMLDKGLPLYGFITEDYWADVGNTTAYLQAHRDVLARRVDVELPGFEIQPGVWVGEDVEMDPTATIEGPALIGNNVRIGAGAHVGPYSVVGDNATISDDARVSNAVVMEQSHVGRFAQIRGGILGRAATLGRGAVAEEGSVLGDEVAIGAGALIKPQVKIYPARSVDAGAIVTQSVVRERRVSRTLFGTRGVSGLVNIGLTPQVAVRLGMAYGSALRRGSVVVTGRDASRAARTVKRAIIAGLNSTGVTCHDLELVAMPLTRFTVRAEQASGGISVRTSPGDPEVVEIRLFEADGSDLASAAQRQIERIFFREDYRRAGPSKIGELEFPARTLEQYTAGLLSSVLLEKIRSTGLKAVVDYAFGPTSLMGPSIMGRLGCDVLAVNAFTDEHRPVLVSEDLDRLLRDLSGHVTKSGSDLGVLFEPGGEVAHLVDDRGRVVPHHDALLAFLGYEARHGAEAIAVPVNAPMACQKIAADAGTTLHWAATSPAALMQRAARPDVAFAGSTYGLLIWPDFMPAPDALMTFCKALEMVSVEKTSLSAIIDDVPTFHMARRDVRTPWSLKGTVMREIASAATPGQRVLLDGVKIVEDDRWALVLPYPDDPECGIWAEAPSAEEAEELASRFEAIVESVVSEEAGGGE
ncbi:MAG TPA: sugar phosphate nucleotidyltransferase [Actinomycetota bacterium]|nr:sugar phosphate nucleotidyltransferase [Actinomycetota bacterium]